MELTLCEPFLPMIRLPGCEAQQECKRPLLDPGRMKSRSGESTGFRIRYFCSKSKSAPSLRAGAMLGPRILVSPPTQSLTVTKIGSPGSNATRSKLRMPAQAMTLTGAAATACCARAG